MPLHRLSILFFFVTLLSAGAEQTFQMLFFQKPPKMVDTLFVYVNGKLKGEVVLRDHVFSPSVRVKSDPRKELILHFTDKALTDLEQIATYPSVKVPHRYKKFLLLANTDTKNTSLPINFNVVNATGPEFKQGDFRFVNLLNDPVTGIVGSKKLNVPPQKIKTVRDFTKHLTDFRLHLNLSPTDPQNKRRTIASKKLRYNDKIRTIFFIYKPEGSTIPRYSAAEARDL